MTTLISVIMPCFNAMQWVEAATASILNQTHSELELIAIDDGSTDATLGILEGFARQDSRVRIITSPRNAGIVAALNRGLDYARGELIARMDADDISVRDRLARQQTYLRQTNLDLCGSWVVEFGAGIPRTVRNPSTEAEVRASMLFQSTICHPTILAHRRVFERYRYQHDYILAEDYDLFSRASSEFRIGNIPQALLRYRRHPQQTTLARRDAMEVVLRRIRLNTLKRQGIMPTAEENRLHNLIRAPSSINSAEDLAGIEAWITKLYEMQSDKDARAVVASQWTRACIRAAPLGRVMWKQYRQSWLKKASGGGLLTDIDMLLLALTKLRYRSGPFEVLRRFGLSA